jgi:hypothetical protein
MAFVIAALTRLVKKFLVVHLFLQRHAYDRKVAERVDES